MITPDLLDELVAFLTGISDKLVDLDAVFQLDLQDVPPASFQLIIKNGQISWHEQNQQAASCIVQITQENLCKLLEGKLNPTTAILTGKLKIQGDRSQLLKLQSILKTHDELWQLYR